MPESMLTITNSLNQTIKLRVSVEGNSRPVLFLHGFPDSLILWNKVAPLISAAGYKTIAIDQRGFGESNAPPGESAYSVECIIADAVAVLKKLGITEKVTVVGHDWGAVIAWLFAIRHPELVQNLVVITVGHPASYRHSGFEQKLKGWYIWLFLCRGLAEFMIKRDNWKSMRRFPAAAEDRARRIADLSRPGRLTAALNWYRANASSLFFAQTGDCLVPTLGIYGPDFALTEEQMTGSERYVKAPWTYVRMDNCGHWIPLDIPQELATTIINWLEHQNN